MWKIKPIKMLTSFLCIKNIKKKIGFGMFMLAMTLSPASMAQQLKLGDPAPPLTPYQWIKGDPVTTFERGKIYIVEMGATWCKPCAAAIPKLTQVAKEYKGSVEVVGLFVQEINREPLDTPKPTYVEEVKKYVARKGKQMIYHVGVDDPQKTLERTWIDAYGASRGVPQTFVIDQQGRLAAHFTGLDEIQLKKTIDALLTGTYSIEKAIEKKKSLATKFLKYDYKKPLYVDGNGGKASDFMFRSVLGRYPENLRGSSSISNVRSWHSGNELKAWAKDSIKKLEWEKRNNSLQGRVQVIGVPLSQLYFLAYSDTLSKEVPRRHPITMKWPDLDSLWWFKDSYGKYWMRPLLEVNDTTPFKANYKSSKNRWNYALTVPDKKKATAAYLQRLMREDLKRYFGYEASIETREMSCWYLKAKPGARSKLRAKDQNGKYRWKDVYTKEGAKEFTRNYRNTDIRDIIVRLSHEFNNRPVGFIYHDTRIDEPFINATGIENGYMIDFDITSEELAYFDKRDMVKVQEYLAKLGLYLEKGTKPMKVVVIRDPKRELLGPVFKD